MKYLFKRDTIFATIAVFIVMGLFSLIPLNTHVLDPIRMALTDISYNDLSFSPLKAHTDNDVNKDIVIINAGRADRDSINLLLNAVSDAGPAVVGADLLFLEPSDSAVDARLANTIQHTPKLVMATEFEFKENGYSSHGFFDDKARLKGYVNFIGEDGGVIRYFSPFESWKDTVALSFSSAIVKQAAPDKYEKLRARSHDVEFINYSRTSDQFFIVHYTDILTGKTDSNLLKNKIVLIGYIGASPDDIEDKHFTPLNEKFTGKSVPDMNGVVIHANIISMILSGKYISKVPGWLSFLLSVLLTWVFMAYTIKFFLEKHLWFHLIIKCIQLLLTIVFVYVGIFMRSSFGISVSFSILIVAIILAVDVLYFYDALVRWLSRKYGFKTVLHHGHQH